MTPARLLLDEMISPRVVEHLHRRGHDVIAVAAETSLAPLTDEQVLAAATRQGGAVVTLDLIDFTVLDRQWRAQGRAHGGILLVPASAFPQDGAFVGALVASLDAAARNGVLPATDEVRFLARRQTDVS